MYSAPPNTLRPYDLLSFLPFNAFIPSFLRGLQDGGQTVNQRLLKLAADASKGDAEIAFSAGNCNLKSLFGGGCLSPGQLAHHYAIPLVQRPYEWPAANVRKLISSLHFTYMLNIRCYTLGNVFVWKENKLSYKYYIIDGQQRITSLVLLMAVLRHIYISKYNKPPHASLQNALVFQGQERAEDDGNGIDKELMRFNVKSGELCCLPTHI